jgi:hypothetical protein
MLDELLVASVVGLSSLFKFSEYSFILPLRMFAMFLAYLFLLDLAILVIFCEQHALRSFLCPFVYSYFLGPHWLMYFHGVVSLLK